MTPAAPAPVYCGTMHRACMYCGRNLGDVSCVIEQDGKTSHGCCDACAEIHFPEVFSELKASGALDTP